MDNFFRNPEEPKGTMRKPKESKGTQRNKKNLNNLRKDQG